MEREEEEKEDKISLKYSAVMQKSWSSLRSVFIERSFIFCTLGERHLGLYRRSFWNFTKPYRLIYSAV